MRRIYPRCYPREYCEPEVKFICCPKPHKKKKERRKNCDSIIKEIEIILANLQSKLNNQAKKDVQEVFNTLLSRLETLDGKTVAEIRSLINRLEKDLLKAIDDIFIALKKCICKVVNEGLGTIDTVTQTGLVAAKTAVAKLIADLAAITDDKEIAKDVRNRSTGLQAQLFIVLDVYAGAVEASINKQEKEICDKIYECLNKEKLILDAIVVRLIKEFTAALKAINEKDQLDIKKLLEKTESKLEKNLSVLITDLIRSNSYYIVKLVKKCAKRIEHCSYDSSSSEDWDVFYPNFNSSQFQGLRILQ